VHDQIAQIRNQSPFYRGAGTLNCGGYSIQSLSDDYQIVKSRVLGLRRIG
jgi:hypothetical protein